ncbi:zinc finger, CCHC-type containing protein [Tanacetum coccineum]
MGDENSNRPRTLRDHSRPSHEGHRNAIELPKGAKVSPCNPTPSDSIDHNGSTRNTTRLRLLCFSLHGQAINWLDRLPAGSISTWDDLTTRFLAQFFPPGRTPKLQKDILMFQQCSSDYIDATLEHELESMECRVESLMRNEVLLEYEDDQVRQLEEDIRKTKDTFVCLMDSLIATLKVKIVSQRVHSTKIEKITRFPTHTPTVTPETLKPIMVHRVSIISNIKPTIYRTPHQHLNSNLKMPILHSFDENKFEYEDEDEVEIKMMRTGMDK